MAFKTALLLSLLPLLTPSLLANPLPHPQPGVNVPITQAEYAALEAGGLTRRDPGSSVNVPITPEEYAALQAGGLTRREANPLDKRDKTMNCGHLVTGKGGSNGHGKWIPVEQFEQVAEEFCNGYVGTDIAKGHETSDTYPITLTNQGDSSKPGPAGNIVFAIYNTKHDGSWVVDHDTCLRAMKGPLGSHAKRSEDGEEGGVLAKRDNCWGTKHNDYEGGYYEVDGIGAFGSEVYASS